MTAPVPILYQDRRVLVCCKPSGVVSTDQPGGLPDLLRAQLGTDCLRTVHRLDQKAAGVMVLARSRRAAQLLSEQVRRGEMEKQYLAVLCGAPEAETGELRDLLGYDRTQRRAYTAATPGPAVREAVLRYRILARQGDRTLVRVTLLTGRTHQIRAQFASRGWPLAGDVKYGGAAAENLGLFSCRLAFTHPESGERLCFTALPPAEGVWRGFNLKTETEDL